MAALASGLLHALAMLVLGYWLIAACQTSDLTELISTIVPSENIKPAQLDSSEILETEPVVKVVETTVRSPFTQVTATIDAPQRTRADRVSAGALDPFAPLADARGDRMPQGFGTLAGLRSAGGRQAAGAARGASAASEAAVDRALEWFIRHQQVDGTWSFDHRTKYCKLDCDHPGLLVNGRVAATSLALLPFLGAGHTHRNGPYRQPISRAMKFLERTLENQGHGCDPNGGGMYAHALATIVLCEAYAMTGDLALLRQAQRGVFFIAASQDPVGGGWRYVPGQPGDISAVGWQLMALKSAHLSYIRVSPDTVAASSRFLDSVQLDDGAAYSYLPGYPDSRASTTAIGLLCRMLLGWKRDDAGLTAGVKSLSARGPSPTDYYYNYYATQVMNNYDGPLWARWNDRMRDQLVAAQVKQGHSAGSWFVDGGQDNHHEIGGRLYCTSLATMTLEVYYRYLPLYQTGKAEEGQRSDGEVE